MRDISTIHSDDPIELMAQLKQFLDTYMGPWESSYGYSESELSSHKLPGPLKELYRFAGKWPIPDSKIQAPHAFSSQDYLRTLDQLEYTDDGKVVFIEENQGNWSCSTDIEGDDPPVYWHEQHIWYDDEIEPTASSSLSRLLVTFILQEAAFSSKVCIGSNEYLSRRFETERSTCRPIWINGPYVGDDNESDAYLWGHVLVLQIWGGFFFASNSPAGIAFLSPHSE